MPSVAVVKDEEYIKSQKGVYLLGRDIREIPCFRSSFLFGITCGTFAGLICFMTTSKAALSSHVGFGSLWLSVFGFWIPCRYKYETEKTRLSALASDSLLQKLAEKRDTPLVEPKKEEQE